MRIFVTGGTGFIGRPLVKKLKKEGHDLLLLSRRPPQNRKEFVQGSLGRIGKWAPKVKRFKPEAAIHLAWEGLPQRDYSVATSFKNLKMGLNLYRFLQDLNCQTILTAGSCWEYGPQEGKLSEDTLIKPANAFPTAKNALCFLGRELFAQTKTKFFWTRIFFVYGPGQRPDSLLPHLIHCGQTGEVMQIKNPKAKLDFIYIEDVVDAIAAILKKAPQSEVYNLGSSQLTSVADIAKIVSQKLGLKDCLKYSSPKDLKPTTSNFYADLTKIKKEIGWQPKTGIAKGIEKMIKTLTSEKKHEAR